MLLSRRYAIMSKCWALKPSERPSFSELVLFMCDLLTDREEKVGPFPDRVTGLTVASR